MVHHRLCSPFSKLMWAGSCWLLPELLTLLEGNEVYRQGFWPKPTEKIEKRTKVAMSKEISKLLFTHRPPYSEHLKSDDGLKHYEASVRMQLGLFSVRYEKAIRLLADPNLDETQKWNGVNKICPHYDRLRSLLGDYVEHRCPAKSRNGPKTFNPLTLTTSSTSKNHQYQFTSGFGGVPIKRTVSLAKCGEKLSCQIENVVFDRNPQQAGLPGY